jgi:hypothetical protein
VPLATLRRGVFRAYLFADRFQGSFLYHYVIQQKGAREILAFGQERSEPAARAAAERQMQFLTESARRNAEGASDSVA